MADGRSAILQSERSWSFRSSRTHVDNVANAIVLAATDERTAGRVYNVAEPDALPYREWARLMAGLMGWRGELVAAPNDVLPPQLRDSDTINYEQHLVASTERIRRELAYAEIVGREEGLRRALAWYAEEPPPDPAAAAKLDYAAEDAALVTLRASAVLKG
jgi:nucleoside-diphosphate-sugar epimerase